MKNHAWALFFLLASPAAFAQFPPQIKNVIVIFQENRTPDNLFHFLTPACPLPSNTDALHACTPPPSHQVVTTFRHADFPTKRAAWCR